MTKSLCALARRPDFDRAAFHDYYERHHAPLGMRHFPFTRYVRNHLIDAPDVGFDTISEFWADDIDATAALMDGPVGDTMREDERRFMDRARIAPAGSDEEILSEGRPADASGMRTALLVRSDKLSPVYHWARCLADVHAGVSIDRLRPWGTPSFPADMVIWLSGWEVPQAAPDLTVTVVHARHVQTPIE
jgi:uncharacterized protein (TIGR02118 family)